MREITHRDILKNDLAKLNRWKFAIMQMTEELETITAEYASIKATNYDKMPSGSGGNPQEEKLITVIARKDELTAKLRFTERKVADLERLLAQLPDDERMIVDCMEVNRESKAADRLAEELGYESRQIFRKRNSALNHLCQLRYGAAYQP